MISTSYSKTWSPNEALHRAAKRGKMDLLKTALRAGAQVNHISDEEKKSTALMVAAENGHVSIVEYLLEQGAILDVPFTLVQAPFQLPTTPMPPPSTLLQLIDIDEEHEHQVPEVEEINVTTVTLSAAVAAAKAGWSDILKILVQKHHADVAAPTMNNLYGEENALLACAHHGTLRCLHVVLNSPGAEAAWPEALEHASFAPSLLDESYTPSSSDLWWIPESSSSSSTVTSSPPTAATPFSASVTSASASSSSRSAESCQRFECRELLLDALLSQGRLSECIPYIQHTYSVIMDNATLDPETGQREPSMKLLVAHHVLADMLERLGTRSSLLEAVNVYGSAYQTAKSMFGNTEITITALGNWSACILRIKSEESNMTNMTSLTSSGGSSSSSSLRKEGEPMLRAALKDIKTIGKVQPNDPRVKLWTKLLLPLQPGRAPFEPMSYLAAEETNPYYKSPPRNEHRTYRNVGDLSQPYPSKEALHPAYSPFLDELEIVNNILEQIHQAREDWFIEKQAKTVSAQELSEKDILMEAVKKNWRCILYAPSKWRKDRAIILTAVTFHGVALQCADIEHRNNEKMCSVAVQNNWRAFSYCTPKMKQKKKVFAIAKANLIEEIRSGNEKTEAWRCLEFADAMLRGDSDVVEAALQVSEDAFQFVDRYVYAEGMSWKKIWPKFIRRCKWRVQAFLITVGTVAGTIGLSYLLIYVVFFSLIWPPTICEQTNITFYEGPLDDQGNATRLMNWEMYEKEYENAHVCDPDLYTPAPAPQSQDVDFEDREKELKELEAIQREESTKLKAEQEEKARRRRLWEGEKRKKFRKVRQH